MQPVSSEFFPALLDSLLDAVVTIDSRGRITGFNRAAERLFGYAAGEALGRDASLIVPAPSGREDEAPFSRCLGPAGSSMLGTPQRVEIPHRDGTIVPCELTVTGFTAGGERCFAGVARRLGERERTLAARGEARLRHIIDSLATLVAVYSTDGVMLDVNQAALDAAGIARADVIGQRLDRTPWVAAVPESGARALRLVREAAAGRVVRDELEIRTAVGPRYLDVILGPLRDASGAITEVLSSGIDVTARRQAQEEVQRRLRQQEAVAGLGALALKTRDLPTLLTTAVETVTAVFGADRCTVAVEIDPRVRPPAIVRDGEAIRSLHALIEGAPHGTYGVLTADARAPHRFTGDEALFLQSVANVLADVVRHDATEAQLRQERELSETLFESLPGLIALVDPHGMLVRWNAAVERLTGHDAARIPRLALVDLVAVDERPLFQAKMQEVFEHGHATVEGHVRSRDGQLTPMLFSALPVVIHDRPHVVAVALDISDRRRLEEQLRHSQKMEALGQLAGGVAHDFNNLLTVITGFAGLTYTTLAPGDPNRENIAEITQAADSAASLTRQLLAFSRRTMIEPVVLDLNAVVADMETMLRRVIGEDVQLTTDLAPGLHLVRGDIGLVSQIVMNLAVNARDAMPTGGRLTITTRNVDLEPGAAGRQAGAAAGPHAVLVVRDTGTGMTPDVRARAFEPFFTTKGVGRGSGLGLAVVHGIVEQLGAQLELESEAGAGTTFTIAFPAVEEEPLRPAAAAESLAGSGTVLLVEDEEGVRKLARMILERHGYTVTEAASGEEALRMLERNAGPLDLVVTDVVMPGIDGREVAEAVRRRFPAAKVLFLSGYTSDAVVRHGIQHHEVAFLQKPFSTTSLASKVRDVLLGR